MMYKLPNTDCGIIDLTSDNIADFGVCGYKDVNKHAELRNKIDWFKHYYPKGLRIKALISQSGGYQGMLEYIPGEFAHRPVTPPNTCLSTAFLSDSRKRIKARVMLQP